MNAGDSCSFETRYVKTDAEATKELARAVLRRNEGSAHIVLAQTCESLDELHAAVPALASLPVIPVPRNDSDNAYPALSWQHFAVEQFVQRTVVCSAWRE